MKYSKPTMKLKKALLCSAVVAAFGASEIVLADTYTFTVWLGYKKHYPLKPL